MGIFLPLLLILINQCESFFQNPPLQLNTITNRLNLTCTSDFDDSAPFTDCEYCVYEFFNNGTNSTIYHDCIYLTNSYRLVTQRCSGFTKHSDIGYGLCDQLPFEYFDINLLCICATDFCNENFTTCKQSVDSTSNLPALPSPVPTLTADSSGITCQDTPLGLLNSTYYCVRDSTPYINITECEEYVQNHTVVCMYLESYNGSYLTLVALPDEDYEYVLVNQIRSMQEIAVTSNFYQYYNETSGSFYVYWEELPDYMTNDTNIYDKCYCLTDNCNFNLTECLNSIVNKTNKNTINVLFMILASLIIIMNFFVNDL